MTQKGPTLNTSYTTTHRFNVDLTLTVCSVIRTPSAVMGAVPLVQVNVSKEPFAEQFRTTVLLVSIASGRLDWMTTLDTGPAGETGVSTEIFCFCLHCRAAVNPTAWSGGKNKTEQRNRKHDATGWRRFASPFFSHPI